MDHRRGAHGFAGFLFRQAILFGRATIFRRAIVEGRAAMPVEGRAAMPPGWGGCRPSSIFSHCMAGGTPHARIVTCMGF
jgi:hypothetical protein